MRYELDNESSLYSLLLNYISELTNLNRYRKIKHAKNKLRAEENCLNSTFLDMPKLSGMSFNMFTVRKRIKHVRATQRHDSLPIYMSEIANCFNSCKKYKIEKIVIE